jgi:hypothetical protein
MNNNQNPITKRLSRDKNYVNDNSYQSTLSEEDIAKKLVDYVRVKSEDVYRIPLGTHIRYFSVDKKTGKRQFRLGGVITKFDPEKKFLVCSNGTLSWSVQIPSSIIYKKLSTAELKEVVKHETLEKVKVDKSEMEKLIEENKELKKMIKQIKTATIDAKNDKNKKK